MADRPVFGTLAERSTLIGAEPIVGRNEDKLAEDALRRVTARGLGPQPRPGFAVMATAAAVVLALGAVLWLVTETGTPNAHVARIPSQTELNGVAPIAEEAYGVRWEVISYLSMQDHCTDLVATAASGAPIGSAGGCVPPAEADESTLEWSVVRFSYEGTAYIAAFGNAGPTVTTVRVTLSDGSVLAVEPSAGTWLAAFPPRPSLSSVEESPAARIEALGDGGSVIVVEDVEDAEIAKELHRPPPGSERSG